MQAQSAARRVQGDARHIDATTRKGFIEIAGTHGRLAAHNARIAQLRQRADLAASFRWHQRKWDVALGAAIFERDWELANPEAAQLLRTYGHGY